jgi:DNA-binding MarR family transcriptional regulator
MEDNYESLKIENQICFPLYATSKEIIRQYQPFLSELDLTYTQYITMLVLWEYGDTNMKELGKHLFLNSGTLTPLVKKLEDKGYVKRKRNRKDERNLIIALTPQGLALKEKAVVIPQEMGRCVKLSPEEAGQLYKILYKVLAQLEEE